MGKKVIFTSGRPTTIFFLRHGQPDNPKKIIKGTADFVLSKKGIDQIEFQAQRLLSERIGAIFASPIKRCVQTAEIVARILNEDRVELDKQSQPIGSGGIRPKLTNNLTEWTSSLDGQSLEEAMKLGEKKYNAAFESHAKVIKRMKDFVNMILQKYVGQMVVAVSHQGPIDLLLMDLQGQDVSRTPFTGLKTRKGEMLKVFFDATGRLQSVIRILPRE